MGIRSESPTTMPAKSRAGWCEREYIRRLEAVAMVDAYENLLRRFLFMSHVVPSKNMDDAIHAARHRVGAKDVMPKERKKVNHAD